jgi:hypothetical protein
VNYFVVQADGIFAHDGVLLITESLLELQRRHGSLYNVHGGSHLFSSVQGWQENYLGNDALCMPPPSNAWRYGNDLAKVLTEVTDFCMNTKNT